MRNNLIITLSALALAACTGGNNGPTQSSATASTPSEASSTMATSSSAASDSSSVPASSSAMSGATSSQSDEQLSAACHDLLTNSETNWRESSLTSDQEIVACLSESLGRPVGFGEKALGGFDPDGSSNLIVIQKGTGVMPEQQLLEAISSDASNWIVFDKRDFNGSNGTRDGIAMYRLHCTDSAVLAALDNATVEECLDHTLWCENNGVSEDSCTDTFFNQRLNDSDLPIRNEMVMSNTTIDGRGSSATFLFNGLKIGADSSGVSTHISQNVIVTNLYFTGAGHTEDHDLDPDMLRMTGESHDIWVHQNTFSNTGDSAFDVKVGAYDISISFNRLINVKRAALHGANNSREINAQITTTMHNNLFVTEDNYYASSAFETSRRVPLMRRGQSHLFNNVFYNYRKDILSVRLGGRILFEDNMVINNKQAAENNRDDMDYYVESLLRDFREGGLEIRGSTVWFGNEHCLPDTDGETGDLTASHGSTPDMPANYNARSQLAISANRLPVGTDLAQYVIATAGKDMATPWVSQDQLPLATVLAQPWASCQ
ncbi:MAG TPA: pectate lyase [Marinagarivorans sp.]